MLTETALDVYNRLGNEPVILMFSGGKDSVVMLDIAVKAEIKATLVHCYFAPGIPSREKLLAYYESRYGIKIDQTLGWYGATVKYGRKVEQKEIYDELRKKYDISYIAEGIKPTDSIIRNAMIKKADKGINYRDMKVYPLYRWYDSAVAAYIRQHKLYLPSEYQSDVKHDHSNPTLSALTWMKYNQPKDYAVIIAEYPQMLDRLKHEAMYGSQ